MENKLKLKKCVQIGHMSNCCAWKLDGSVFRLGTCQIAVHGSWMDLCSDWAHVKLLCMEVGWICVQIGHMSNCCAQKLDGSVFRLGIMSNCCGRKLDGSVFRLGTCSYIALQGFIRPMKTMTIKYMDYAATRGLTYSAAYW